MSPMDAWDELGQTDLKALAEARLQAHHALQWPARAARAFIEPRPDDSHTSLSWDQGRQTLNTQKLPNGEALALRLTGLTLLWYDREGIGSQFPLDGVRDADAGAWIAQQLHGAGYDPSRLQEPPAYEIPACSVSTGAPYAVGENEAAFRELTAWFASADTVLESVVHAMSALRPGPSPVRCWPHHFDIASLIYLDEGETEERRSIGVGFSPGDETYAEPYYYVTPWPYPDAARLPKLPPAGRWHTDGYVAAIATASRVQEMGVKRLAVLDFLQSAIARSRDLLGD